MKHIVALSGGKDSTALALRLAEVEPREYEYVWTPTGDELPPMIEHWKRLEDRLGKSIRRITAPVTLVQLTKEKHMLPNFRARFCTPMLKIRPFQAYMLNNLPATAYVGLRADEESRSGADYGLDLYVTTRHPLREWGWGLSEVGAYLASCGVEIPPRTDCARCFYQTLHEWYLLWRDYPNIYASAVDDEDRTQHTYRSPQRDTWPADLRGLSVRFKAGDIPTIRARGEGCRFCSL